MAPLVRAVGTICSETTQRRFPKGSSHRWPRAGLLEGTEGVCAPRAPWRAAAWGSRRTKMGAQRASRSRGAPAPCRTENTGQWRAAYLKTGTTPSSGVPRRLRVPRIQGRVTSCRGTLDLGIAALRRRRRRCRARCWSKNWKQPHTLFWKGSRRGRWIPYWRRWSPEEGCRATALWFPGQSWGWAAMWHPHSCSCVSCTAGPTSSTLPSSNRSVSVRASGLWTVQQCAATPITTAGSVGQVSASQAGWVHPSGSLLFVGLQPQLCRLPSLLVDMPMYYKHTSAYAACSSWTYLVHLPNDVKKKWKAHIDGFKAESRFSRS